MKEDAAEAVKWYQMAAEQGHAEAQNNLGMSYRTGSGVEEDDVEAVRWIRKAAEQGDALAQKGLGFMYIKGEGVTVNLATAKKWLRLAAEQGNVNAQGGLDLIDQMEAADARKKTGTVNADTFRDAGAAYETGDYVNRAPAPLSACAAPTPERPPTEAEKDIYWEFVHCLERAEKLPHAWERYEASFQWNPYKHSE